MAAMELDWVPQSLYGASVSAVTENFAYWKEIVRTLPSSLQFDVYHKLYQQGQLSELATEFKNLEVFSKMLLVVHKRLSLHHCFQAIRDHGDRISEIVSKSYVVKVHNIQTTKQCDIAADKNISLGFRLGTFLSDAGWDKDSAMVFAACYDLCLFTNQFEYAFECCIKLLHVYNANCMYLEAEKQFRQAQELFMRLTNTTPTIVINLAALFAEYSAFHFGRSEYHKAYQWSIEALKMLNKPGHVTTTTTVDVLRMASKASVVKRHVRAAEHLVKHAMRLSKSVFGSQHPKYSSTLLDYGFYLLNIDNVCQSVKVYQTALNIRQSAFGGQNLHVALAHEDLAYASYVHQYSTGRFDEAKAHADAAINILSNILPQNHLLLASSKRVKALILEEIAIDLTTDSLQQRLLLKESHDLHQQSLFLSKKAFGEKNVQTAKHYGNLGRLYQSMEQYKEAEIMHLKAIAIKEEILGSNDYEVALSIGHLASLYNYDLKEYDKAEKLYMRSISIAKSLFGDGYSGLEYDYRGLIKLYHNRGDIGKTIAYHHILNEWSFLREEQFAQQPQDAFAFHSSQNELLSTEDQTTAEVIDAFLKESIFPQSKKTTPSSQQQTISLNHEQSPMNVQPKEFAKVLMVDEQSNKNAHTCTNNSVQDLNASTECNLNSDSIYYSNIDKDVLESLMKFNICPLKSSEPKDNANLLQTAHKDMLQVKVDNVKNTVCHKELNKRKRD